MPIYLDAFYSITGCFQKTIGCLHFVLKWSSLPEFVYEQSKELDKKFNKSIKRLINDHNRLAKLYGLIEKARLSFFGYSYFTINIIQQKKR